MSKHTYKEIIEKAKTCKNNVEKKYTIGINPKWSYYFAKAILTPNKDITKTTFDDAPKPTGTHISRQINKTDYLKLAKDLTNFVEKKHRLPNYLEYKDYKIRTRLYTYALARIIVYYNTNKKLPNEVNTNSKVFDKPIETSRGVYDYFIKVFGKFDDTIDGALQKIKDKKYSYYYDDTYTNKESIDRLKTGKGINCTDSCQLMYNILLVLIIKGKYKKVECLHVDCSSGGHVKLRITLNDGTKIIRDPACVISQNNKALNCVWCTNTPKAVNPSWFMENLNR